MHHLSPVAMRGGYDKGEVQNHHGIGLFQGVAFREVGEEVLDGIYWRLLPLEV